MRSKLTGFFCLFIFVIPFFSYAADIDEYSHKTEIKKAFDLNGRELEVKTCHKISYDMEDVKLMKNQYEGGASVSLTDYLEIGGSYIFNDRHKNDDGHEIEAEVTLHFCLPLGIEAKDENKFCNDITEGTFGYQNELELCKEVLRHKSAFLCLLCGNVLAYDGPEDEFSEDEIFIGLEFSPMEGLAVQAKYVYVDDLDSSDYSSKIETEVTYKF